MFSITLKDKKYIFTFIYSSISIYFLVKKINIYKYIKIKNNSPSKSPTNLTTLTSWQKYLPPNCAPMPNFWVILSTFSSISRSLKPLPYSLPSIVVWRFDENVNGDNENNNRRCNGNIGGKNGEIDII